MRAIFQVQAPGGAYIWRGDLTEGFLRYRFGGLIFGGAYIWRGLFSEFYGISGFRIPQAKICRISGSGFPCMERCCGTESFTMIISLLLMDRGETLRAVYLNLKILFETVDGSLGLSSDSSCDQLK